MPPVQDDDKGQGCGTKRGERMNNPRRRYVKFEFFGYAPVDLAIQLHLLGKKCDVNMCGEDMKPYTEYEGAYDMLINKVPQ